MSAPADGDVPRLRPLAGAYWAVVGAALALGIIGLLSIGVVLLAVALAMTVVGARSPRLRGRSASMALVGAAAAPLLLAWVNRGGPGEVCSVQGQVTSCSEQWSPWPFLLAAGVLVATGVLLARRSGT